MKLLFIVLITFVLFATIHSGNSYAQSNIVYLEVPESISTSKVNNPDSATTVLLNTLLIKKTQEFEPVKNNDQELPLFDLIVIYTKNGKPILSENTTKQVATEGKTLVSKNLTFTFNSDNWAWTQFEIDTLKKWIDDFIPAIKKIYGDPAFDDTINIMKDPSISFSGLYGGHSIILKIFDRGVLLHEIIHAFHNRYIISFPNYEEGMTRATEIEVSHQLTKYSFQGTTDHGYAYDVFYDAHNNQKIINQSWGFSSFTLLRYQLSSYVFTKCYIEDTTFFRRFNSYYYDKIKSDEQIKYTESKLKSIFSTIKPAIENENFSTWYSAQNVMNSTDTYKGDFLYTRYYSGMFFPITHFNRDENGSESGYSNSKIEWRLYNCNDTLIDSGYSYTNYLGNCSVQPLLPNGYYGRIKLVTSVNSPTGIIRDIAYSTTTKDGYDRTVTGIFGLVSNMNEGSVSIQSLNNPSIKDSVNLKNGIFCFPEFENLEGSFSITYKDPFGKRQSRVITKDANNYFVQFGFSVLGVSEIPIKNTVLKQNAPNPFSSETTIAFQIDKLQFIDLSIYDMCGRKVQTLVNELKPQGTYSIKWNAEGLLAGMYYYKIEYKDYYEIRKCILVK